MTYDLVCDESGNNKNGSLPALESQVHASTFLPQVFSCIAFLPPILPHYLPALQAHSAAFFLNPCQPVPLDRLIGLVVRHPPRERKIPSSNSTCAGIFSGSSRTSDLKIGTPVATLPGAWRYRVSTGTGQPGVSIL